MLTKKPEGLHERVKNSRVNVAINDIIAFIAITSHSSVPYDSLVSFLLHLVLVQVIDLVLITTYQVPTLNQSNEVFTLIIEWQKRSILQSTRAKTFLLK